MLLDKRCPNCDSIGMSLFYEIKNVPVNSVILLPTKEEALDFPRGDIELGYCKSCGFISNIAFNPGLLEYSTRYEATQGFSSTFNAYLNQLTKNLIDRYDLRNKDIIEIGCGQGEFLTLLCEQGGNRGIGFDPTFDSQRDHYATIEDLTIIKDFYSENYANQSCDFICCRMTLEHIHNPYHFVNMVKHTINEDPHVLVFFQVPDVSRILRELAFWDIYYEHCSYFSLGSLSRLFRKCGFTVLDLGRDYDSQYITIAARPGNKQPVLLAQENDLETLTENVLSFEKNYQQKIGEWRDRLQEISQPGKKSVIWGASSKAVSFLTTLNIQNEIEYLTDINPNKHKTYVAGTGQMIVAPEFLQEYKPDSVIIMNPIYKNEIKQYLDNIGIAPDLVLL